MYWETKAYGNERHVIPVDDDEPHYFRGCRCHPVLEDEDPPIYVHNSFDGREAFESGIRKPS